MAVSSPVATAYNAIADVYNQHLASEEWIRDILQKEYLRFLKKGDCVLDVGCGTGIDSIFLAQEGIYVRAIDISPRMIEQLNMTIQSMNLTGKIKTTMMDFASIASLHPVQFDGIISGYSGLNTLPDLSAFAVGAAEILKPGSPMILHILNGNPLWRRIGMITRGRFTQLTTCRNQKQKTVSISDIPVQIYFFSPTELYERFFAAQFQLHSIRGIGFLLPQRIIRRLPRPLKNSYGSVERKIGRHIIFARWGEFFIITMIKK